MCVCENGRHVVSDNAEDLWALSLLSQSRTRPGAASYRRGRSTRLAPTLAFREFERAVTAYPAQAIRPFVDDEHLTFTEAANLTGVSQVDRAFVEFITSRSDDLAITASIIDLRRAVDIRTVAEASRPSNNSTCSIICSVPADRTSYGVWPDGGTSHALPTSTVCTGFGDSMPSRAGNCRLRRHERPVRRPHRRRPWRGQ